MKRRKTNTIAVEDLRYKLAGCHLTVSSLRPDFHLEKLFNQMTTCRIIKENERRQVYYIKTSQTGYFLKVSTLVRRKDKWRHFLLPFRKWSEWRNLHRLLKVGIATAKPVLKGEDNKSHPARFFLLMEEVAGSPLEVNTSDDVRQLGEFAAGLHSKGVYHADLHPDNIIISPDGRPRLIDVQQVIFLRGLPHRLRVYNLGKFYNNIRLLNDSAELPGKFIKGYNIAAKKPLSQAQLEQAAAYHQQKKFRSRSKRCCRNSSEFVVVRNDGLKGYKRKSFLWGLQDLRRALEKGQPLKGSHVFAYQGVCIKKQLRRPLHADRCLISWKMSRALEVRGIAVPRSLGYFIIDNVSCFVSELLDDRLHLNTYLSSITDARTKRRALKKLALWLQKFYDTRVWQRDFKSDNILCHKGDYFMVDLDGVKIRRSSEHKQIVILAQLNASVSNAVTLKDRLRFYHYLTAGQKPPRQQRRAVYRRVWDITRTKTTFYYDLDIDQLWRHGR